MLRKLRNRKRGQSTAEYAILIALVVAAVIAMQQYAKRTLQARIYDASKYLVNQGSGEGIGNTSQFEPGYLTTDFNVGREAVDTEFQNARAATGLQYVSDMNIKRSGYQNFAYNGVLE
ncbi:MAG TPA: hypothetical protein PL155_02595 [Candidatus Omnitrophota bacterium]|nr:hypothetical protein [Candidatus Omnitrophota bacterium]HPD84625.1 hypothetical protein [Candidatus Omnitrophota bacterium]HRZ03483.1 hypothetical protein [Candidatus Omnitrophota bacterium]